MMKVREFEQTVNNIKKYYNLNESFLKKDLDEMIDILNDRIKNVHIVKCEYHELPEYAKSFLCKQNMKYEGLIFMGDTTEVYSECFIFLNSKIDDDGDKFDGLKIRLFIKLGTLFLGTSYIDFINSKHTRIQRTYTSPMDNAHNSLMFATSFLMPINQLRERLIENDYKVNDAFLKKVADEFKVPDGMVNLQGVYFGLWI